MNLQAILSQQPYLRVSDGERVPLLSSQDLPPQTLILIWPQLGDFDSLEYAWWLKREASWLQQHQIQVRALGIGDRASGQRFCEYTGFSQDSLWVDPQAHLHRQLGLYAGLSWPIPGGSPTLKAWFNLLLMCAGIGSSGTLAEVFRGYWGDRQAPQLIPDEERIQVLPWPPLTIQGSFFKYAGGTGFQRPFELATLRLRNMAEVLSHWTTYVPDATYLTQRGATFVLNARGDLLYEHRDRGILGFAANMSDPLAFIRQATLASPSITA